MPKINYHDSSGVERSLELGSEPILIGRLPECQIQTQDGLVSRRHARIVYDGNYWIEDLGSANGVYLGAERVQRAQIRFGDEVICGSLTIRIVPDMSGSSQHPPQQNYGPPPVAPGSVPPPLPPAGASAMTPPPLSTTTAPPPPLPPPLPRAAASQVLSPPVVDVLAQQLQQQELEEERRRRREAERDRDDKQRQVGELQVQLAQIGAQGEELRRLRTESDRSRAQLSGMEEERDRLRARVQELEARPSGGGDEAAMLRRKVDQLTSELQRIRRGGAPAPDAASPVASVPDGRVAELELKVRALEQERDALRISAAGPGLDETRRMLREMEQERDRLQRQVGSLNSSATGAMSKTPARVGECLHAASDGLADLRGAVRATGDDIALDQLEQTRGHLREAMALLGLS